MAVSKRLPADHLGPLVPPPGFVRNATHLHGAALAPALDDAVVQLLKLQRDLWISVVTDGELRRRYGGQAADLPAEARFTRGHTDLLVKLRLPRAVTAAEQDAAPIADRTELEGLLDLGIRYLQLDGAAYGALLHEPGRQALRARGVDPDRQIDRLLERDRAVLRDVPKPEGAKIGICFHDVTGIAGAPFQAALNLAAAERVLHGLPADRFLFDCGGDAAADDFGFLRLVPAAAEAVLGLIDGRAPDLPDPDAIVGRIDAAAEVIDTDRLALSPRHGFGLAAGEDPEAAWQRQRRVLELVLDASSRAWGIDF